MASIFAWINIGLLVAGFALIGYYYTLSVMPCARRESRGEKAWKECRNFRLIASFFMFTTTANYILWFWFPIPQFDWTVANARWPGVLIAFVIAIPGIYLNLLGVKAAGKESISPSPDTPMYGGIYRKIRHPQALGEFPLYIAMGFAVNSWFLVICGFLFCIIYTPIMIHYEERDLVLRFGDKYKVYQKSTGALFPKIFSKNKK